ncbi:MAG TPA: pitrilysin family protein [Spirochaetota bacterium]|nr:pitrilysin family protein [Spirochaetota bacterium]
MFKLNLKENVEKIILDNGITLLLEKMDYVNSSSVGFFLKSGSRNEKDNENGYSHFCEHMIFKGTERYTKEDISRYFDEMGGYINAYTTHETILVYNKIPYFNIMENINIVTDMFNNSIFDQKELELEKNVILNEINSTMEDPQEKIHEDFMFNIFKNNQLAKPIIGNKDSILNVSRDNIYEFYKNYFSNENIIISVAGNFEKNEIIDFFSNVSFRKGIINSESRAVQNIKGYDWTIMHSEQLHILTGTANFNCDNDIDFFKCGLFNLILGESMSGRLFQKLREELGLCYSVYSFFNKFKYENLFGIYLSILPKNIDITMKHLSEIIKNLKRNGIIKEELEKAKKQKIGELILNYDNIQNRMKRNALLEIRYKRHLSYDYIIELIDKITVEDINNLIKEIFVKENFFTQFLYKKKLKFTEMDF